MKGDMTGPFIGMLLGYCLGYRNAAQGDASVQDLILSLVFLTIGFIGTTFIILYIERGYYRKIFHFAYMLTQRRKRDKVEHS